MALTVSTGTAKGRSNDVFGARHVTILRVTGDNSYPSGGWAFDPKAQGHQGKVHAVFIAPRYDTAGNKGSAGIFFQYDFTNKKILAFWDSTPAAAARLTEVTAATDLSGVVLDVIVFSD